MLSLKELVRRVAELLRKLLASKVLRNSLGGVLHLFQLLKRCLLGTRRKTIKGPGKDSGRTGSVRWLDKEAKSAVGRDPSCSIGQSGNSTAVEDATSCEKGYICASEVPASARLPAFHQHTPAFRASQHLRLDTAAPPRARSSPIVIDTPNGVDHDEYDIQVQSASTASLNSDPWQDRASYISIEPEEEHVTYRPTSRATTRADSRMVSRAQSRSRASRSTRDPSLPRSREPSPRRPMSGDFTPQPSPTHAHFEHAPLPSPARSSRTLYRLDPDTLQLPVPMSRESSVASVRGSILKIKRTMQPCMGVERYNREVVIQKTEKSEDHVKLEAMCLSFSLENIPKHWQACTHPEGALYFYHPKKRIYTDAYLCDPDILLEIEAFAAHIKDMIRDRECSVPSGSDLVLELGKDDAGETTWAYYFAYHENRTLFWLTEHDVHVFMHQEVRAVRSKAHIKHELESQYWNHIELFPHGHDLRKEVAKELQSMLIHFAMDQITSTSSTASYTSEEARSMLGLIQDAESIGSTPYTVSLVARLMSIFVHHRFLHYHGQNGARLCHDQSVHGEKTSSRTPLITLLSPVFFNAPEVHLRGLEELWVDGLINQVKWRVFVEKLRSDWDMFIINGTVLLNANVAFLTIPDVDPGAGDPTIAKVFSFVSIIMSVGGVVLGLLLVRHHRVKVRETAEDVCGYLTSRRHPTLGLETLAILYALPYALLMWAMVTFLIAFACECFVWPFTAAIWSTAIFWVIIGSLIFWCIYTLWDWHGSALSTMRSRVADFLSHVQQRAKSAPVAFTTMCEKLPRSTPSVTTDSIRDERDVERN